jgi:hypothetical protein
LVEINCLVIRYFGRYRWPTSPVNSFVDKIYGQKKDRQAGLFCSAMQRMAMGQALAALRSSVSFTTSSATFFGAAL